MTADPNTFDVLDPADPIAAFAVLAPVVDPLTAVEHDAIRAAAFTVSAPATDAPVVGAAPVEVDLASPLRTDDLVARIARSRRRGGVAVGVAAAASIVAVLAVARRPEVTRGGGGASTVPAAVTTTTNVRSTSVASVAPVPSVPSVTTTIASSPSTSATTANPTPDGSALAGSVPPSPTALPNERLDAIQSFFSGTENSARVRRRATAGEPYVAACMRERGWEYVENVVGSSGTWPQGELQKRDPDGFRKRYGYGIVIQQLQPQLTIAGAPDPNDLYRASLSAEEQQRYQVDRFGDLDAKLKPKAGTSKPCWQVASEAVLAAGDAPATNHELAALDPQYDPGNHPLVLAAQQVWAACMTRVGYTNLAVRNDALLLVDRRARDRVAELTSAWTPESGELPHFTEAQGRELLEYELVIAAADNTCALGAGFDAARQAAIVDIGAKLRYRFPDVVVEPYDPNMT